MKFFNLTIITTEVVEVVLNDIQEARDMATNIQRLRQSDSNHGQKITVEIEEVPREVPSQEE